MKQNVEAQPNGSDFSVIMGAHDIGTSYSLGME
jgi:hypothetical protein